MFDITSQDIRTAPESEEVADVEFETETVSVLRVRSHIKAGSTSQTTTQPTTPG
jgi:hypothetical protein